MDGILDELLRLEDAKHHALIGFDPDAYGRSVHEQTLLLEDTRLPAEARKSSDKLLAFSKLASLNTNLYRNLLATTPWIGVANLGYTGNGQMGAASMQRTFSAEA